MSWHTFRPSLKAEVLGVLSSVYPDLHFRIDGGQALAQGAFPVRDDEGDIDRFAVEVRFLDNFPERLPVVREIGRRIPHSRERHINPEDGTCCLLVPEEWFVLAGDKSFQSFMAGPVHNFFLGQSLVERGEPWPFGERPHGTAGAWEAFEDLLGVKGQDTVKRYLECLTKREIKGHWSCPCGSGAILRRCHVVEIRSLQMTITPEIAIQMIARVSS